MDGPSIDLRIRVILVSTRAAARKLATDSVQRRAALARGHELLHGIERDVAADGGMAAVAAYRSALEEVHTAIAAEEATGVVGEGGMLS